MSGRHQPLNGADSENVDPADTFCDVCLKTIYDGSLRAEKHGGSIAWVCGKCRDRATERYERMAS